MIIRCPSCRTRRDVPFVEDTAGAMLVDCLECGHDWIEGPPLPVPEQRTIGAMNAIVGSHGTNTRPLIDAARDARQEFDKMRRARRVRVAAWAGLAMAALTPLVTAATFPEGVVAVVPGTIQIYEKMGMDVNIYGLEIRHVDLQHLIVDGRQVIAVKGELANFSSTDRKIPWLRFGLSADDGTEVYHWTLDTEVRPLKPGESTSFVTRLASPPEAARNIEIRFARANEIGSNQVP